MSSFWKGVLNYAVQSVVALLVGTIVGSLVGIGVRWLLAGEVSRDEAVSIINGAIAATSFFIVVMSGTGMLPMKGKKP